MWHRGWATATNGKKVFFTPELLREMERNSNFVVQAGILQPPVRYDHPAFGAPDKENHGKLVRYEVRGNSLFAAGTNWSERLQEDKAREAVLAYSGEFVDELEYPDPKTGTMRKLGPTVVGMAILGDTRPSMKNLMPLSKFEFSDESGAEVDPIDQHITRTELQKSGLLSDYVDGTHFFGEVVNDASRFFSEEKPKEQTMTDAEIQALVASASKTAADAAVAAAVAPLQAKITEQATQIAAQKTAFDTQINAMSEASKRKTEAHAFCEKVFENKVTNVLFRERAEDILADASFSESQLVKVRGLIEAAPAGMVEAGRKGGNGNDKITTEEPDALADLKVKHFSDIDAHEAKIHAGIVAFGEFKPDAFKGVEKNTAAQIEIVRKHVVARDSASA